MGWGNTTEQVTETEIKRRKAGRSRDMLWVLWLPYSHKAGLTSCALGGIVDISSNLINSHVI